VPQVSQRISALCECAHAFRAIAELALAHEAAHRALVLAKARPDECKDVWSSIARGCDGLRNAGKVNASLELVQAITDHDHQVAALQQVIGVLQSVRDRTSLMQAVEIIRLRFNAEANIAVLCTLRRSMIYVIMS
jgi:hypothetical protein